MKNIFFKLIAGISGILILVILIVFLQFYLAGKKAENYVGDFQPDISQLKDGKYHGTFSFIGDVKAEIQFEITKGKLMEYDFIELTGTPGYGADYAVKTQIDAKKNLTFNAATGATITSNFAKAAIRDAIKKGPLR